MSGANHQDGDVVGRAGSEGGQQAVARLAGRQGADLVEGVGEACHADAQIGGAGFDEPVGVEDESALARQPNADGLVLAAADAEVRSQAEATRVDFFTLATMRS